MTSVDKLQNSLEARGSPYISYYISKYLWGK